MAIPQIFAQQGEEAFRRLEAQAMAQAGARTGCVIATGGGTVLRPENRQAMAQNGFVIWLQRDLSLLPTEGQECESLHRVVLAGGVDGCTKERTETVDQLPMSVHLSILRSVTCLVEEHLEQEAGRLRKAISA